MDTNQYKLFHNTPAVAVLDNRGLTVREIQYYRHPDSPENTDTRITRHQFDPRGFLAQSIDPRLYDLREIDNTVKPNFSHLTSLTGTVLLSQSADAGITATLTDIEGRPFVTVSGTGVITSWQYEDASLPGRPLSVTEQPDGGVARITERFIYAGSTEAEKKLNLAGRCVSHYDAAGLVQTESIALTGVPLAVARRFLKDMDNPDTVVDWEGSDTSGLNDMLATEVFTTLNTADATGAVLTTTDAKGNYQRMTYDIAGLLSGAWLTLKGGAEQIILRSLTYSAVGQKLREEHGNGVVTTYTYEPETLRLTGIMTERPAGHPSGAKILQNLHYIYDPVGNVLCVENDAETTQFWKNQQVVPENTYAYDSLYQLVTATGREMASLPQQGSALPAAMVPLPTDANAFTTYTRSWKYDAAGNLTQMRHSSPASGNSYTTAFTVSDRNNRAVLSTLTDNPTKVDALFDATGHQIQLQPGQSLSWTLRGELMKVTPVVRNGKPSDVESYRYDSNSRRVLKISSQVTGNSTFAQRVVYLPGIELRTADNGGTIKEDLHTIIVGEAGRAQVRALHWESGQPDSVNNNQLRYSYDNLLGSSSLELNGSGEIISQEEYYPYGGTSIWAARSKLEADYKTIRYSGKELDATGLYFYGYRYYQPWVGRWLSADPAGMVDGLNLFRMAKNNPVSMSDPNGFITVGADARIRVSREFIAEQHIGPIEQAGLEYNAILSFRDAGIYTIDALNAGAAAKGHNILEKTIKDKSLKPVYGESAGSMIKNAKEAGLIGLVGNWKGEGNTISGIWVHNIVKSRDEVFPLTLSSKDDLGRFRDQVKQKNIVPYTGDYDMHEIVLKKTRRPPGVGSLEETGVRNAINRNIASIDSARPFDQIHMNPIRHGAQNNFVPYMWQNELHDVEANKGMLDVVARPGPFPVAIVDNKEWVVVDTEDEWRGYFLEKHISQPEHWSRFPVRDDLTTGLLRTGSGRVLPPVYKQALGL